MRYRQRKHRLPAEKSVQRQEKKSKKNLVRITAQKKTARRADGPEVFWGKVSEHQEKDGQHGDGHGDRIPFAGR